MVVNIITLLALLSTTYAKSRVLLGQYAPLKPDATGDELLVNHDDHSEIVYMSKKCVEATVIEGINGAEQKAEALRQGLLDEEKECLKENDHNNVINQNYLDYYFFLTWDEENSDDAECVNGININMEDYCITKIVYEPIATPAELFHPTCTQQNGAWWSLKDLESEQDFPEYSGYHYSNFQNENIIVYVLDEPINLNHDQFSHLQDKASLGGYQGNVGNHGSHVAGTIIGKEYGILRDATIPLRGYGICTVGGCPWADITAGLDAVIADLLAHPNKKGVINMSIGGECGANCNAWDWYGWHFDRIIEAGGIIVVAAGNENSNSCHYAPAYSNKAITVGAYAEGHTRSWFSNHGACIDAWGPGSNIQSAYYEGLGNMQGTSMASPAIAGIVGGLLAANDALNLDDIKSIISCGHHSHTINDCQDSATCNAYRASCGDLYSIASSHVCTDPSNSIDFGQMVTGSIKAKEKAMYRVEIGPEHGDDSVLFSVCGSSYDTYLYFYDANYNEITKNDDSGHAGCGFQGSLYFDTLAAGDYWIAVGGYSSSAGNYRLAMANGVMACGDVIDGTINSYEQHFYAINPNIDQEMIAESCGSYYDTYFRLYNDDFSVVLSAADDVQIDGENCGLRGDINVPAAYHDIRYLSIGGFSASAGTYRIELKCPIAGGGCHARGPCNDGYMDISDGNYNWWACGIGCVGGTYYTDYSCNCVCQDADECSQLPAYNDFNVYRYVPQLNYVRMISVGWYIVLFLLIMVTCVGICYKRKMANETKYKMVSMVDSASDIENIPINQD